MVLSSDKLDALYAKDMVERVKYLNKAAVLVLLAALMFLLAAVNVDGQENPNANWQDKPLIQLLEEAQARAALACTDELEIWARIEELLPDADYQTRFDMRAEWRYRQPFFDICVAENNRVVDNWVYVTGKLWDEMQEWWWNYYYPLEDS